MNERRKPYVFVTLEGPDDGGDFGPNTPGTKTSGLQEAIDYAHDNCRDVYIYGGRGGMHEGEGVQLNVYTLDETLKVPWSQDFRLDGGNYVLSYRKNSGDAIHIDSQMNCRYKFGLIASASDGAAVRFKPETPGPDDFVVITASVFDFSAACSRGTGILIDISEGPIVNSKIFAEETNTFSKGVYIQDDGSGKGSFSNNWLQVMFTNQCHATEDAIGFRIGDPGSSKISHNRFFSSLHAPTGVYFDEETKRFTTPEVFEPSAGAIGADIFAQNNRFEFAFHGSRAPGNDIIFEAEARDNTVSVWNLPYGITNKAKIPTNRIIQNEPVGFNVVTPAVPASGAYLVNTSAYLVEVFILTPGQVLDWTIVDAGGNAQTLAAGFSAGQTFLLEPGDKIKFNYTDAPTWRWRAFR